MNHKDLDVWKSAILLAGEVYKETVDFPKHGQFGMTSQLRRAAVSVSAHIAEGSARKGNKELTQFLHISLGSLAELETPIISSNKIGYFNNEKQDNLLALVPQCSKLTCGLIKYVKNNPIHYSSLTIKQPPSCSKR